MERIVGIEPPDYNRVNCWMEGLGYAYDDFFDEINAGSSLLGRRIRGMLIGNSASPALYCGGVHGREWITTLLLMYFAEDLLHAYSHRLRICDIDVYKMLNTKGVLILPALNPDGIEISINGADEAGFSPEMGEEIAEICRSMSEKWKSNARGVDINRNFDAAWDDMRSIARDGGINGPSIGGWTGEHPESEPETQAVVRLCRFMRFRHAIAFHSQGEEIYWSYRNFTPPKAHLMARILSVSSGYPLREPEQSASSAGLKDWFMEKYHAPAFTVEIGSGECPIPLSHFRFLYSRLREMLVLGIAM